MKKTVLTFGLIAGVIISGYLYFAPVAVAAVDHNLAAGLCQRLGTGPAKPSARGTHDRLAAGNTQIHAVMTSNEQAAITATSRPAAAKTR